MPRRTITVRIKPSSREKEETLQLEVWTYHECFVRSLRNFALKGVNQKMEAYEDNTVESHDVNFSHLGL